MASKMVMSVILAAAKPIGATIRKGKPFATVVGAFLGAGIAACSAFVVMLGFVPFFVILGAIIGATVTATVFKQAPSLFGARTTDSEPFSLGAVLQSWMFEDEDFKSLVVLLERSLYVVREDSAPWEEVVQKLSSGEDPDLPLGDLIRLDELVRIEMEGPEAKEIVFVHFSDGKTKRRPCDFGTTEERDELIACLERQIGKSFSRTQQPLGFPRAILTPAILAAIGGIFFSLTAWLSAHWTAHPPLPPRGRTEQDDVVRLLVWAGPERILITGAVVVVAILPWLASRVVWPPQIEVIQICDESS